MSFDRMLSFPRSRAGWEIIAAPLSDGCWHSLEDLGALLAAETDMKADTARGLLSDAYAEGYLSRKMVERRRYYRVTAKGLDSRPELRVV